MKIHEYQAKQIFAAHGINIPKGVVVARSAEGAPAAAKLGFPLMVKAQVHAGGRGKAGAIRKVANQSQLDRELPEVFNLSIQGLKADKILLEQAVAIAKQYYLGLTVDRARKCNILMASAEGGIEIEEVARQHPEKIIQLPLTAARPLTDAELQPLISLLALPAALAASFSEVVKKLAAVYFEADAMLVEINPLILTTGQEWVACDAKMIIDENALYRQEAFGAYKEEAEDNALEKEAHKLGLAYVKLSGNIGIIGNGAGLVMATMDEIKRVGGEPANFLDIGGGAKHTVVQKALELLYGDEQTEGIFINIFGGITRCDEVAEGIIRVIRQAPRNIPVVLRLVGTRAEEGKKLLAQSRLPAVNTMEEGARSIVAFVKEKK